jgi:hypothetical protein
MSTGRSRGGLLTRLERLESCVVREEHRFKVRFGRLKRLPQDYKGEKHVVIAKQLPSRNGQEWVEFEELPGADPHPKPLQAVNRDNNSAPCESFSVRKNRMCGTNLAFTRFSEAILPLRHRSGSIFVNVFFRAMRRPRC